MGQVIIDVPQNINFRTTIESVEAADEILEIIGKREKIEMKKAKTPENADDFEGKTSAIIPPRRRNLKKDLEEAVGIYADREESADEIARQIRDKNNGIIEKPKKMLQTVSLILPYNNLDEIDENEAIGIWADREESAEEIARRIRKNNRKTT